MTDREKKISMQMKRKLKHVIEEYVKPAWENWVEQDPENLQLPQVAKWVDDLFTHDSNVRVFGFHVTVQPMNKIRYRIVLAYVNKKEKIIVEYPFSIIVHL